MTSVCARRTLRSAGLPLVLALVLTGCSSGQESSEPAADGGGKDDGKIRIAYLQKQGDQQYFVDQAAGAKEAAEELGAELTVVNLGDDANKAISEVDAAIAQDFDAIAIVVPDQQVGPQVIDKAQKAGIPLLASDDIIKDESGKEAPFVGFDGTAMGQAVGTKAGELFQSAGWKPEDTRILRVSKEDLSVCEQRVDGATETFASTSGADVEVIKVGTDASVTDSQDKTGAVITANPGVKHWVVYGCNDESATGAVTALQNAGVQPADIIGVGLGAYLTCKDWKAGQETGNKAALFISGVEVGRSAVEALVKAVEDGAELPAQTIAKTAMVDAETYEEAGVECV
jgi:L-arabinose transport system substrate-binding protein